MNITITEVKDDTVVILDVAGRIDSTTADHFGKQLTAVLDGKPKSLVLDFAGLDFISSAGIRVLMLAAKRTRPAGIALALCALKENVYGVFDISGIVPIFAIHPDRAAALAAVR